MGKEEGLQDDVQIAHVAPVNHSPGLQVHRIKGRLKVVDSFWRGEKGNKHLVRNIHNAKIAGRKAIIIIIKSEKQTCHGLLLLLCQLVVCTGAHRVMSSGTIYI